MTWKSLHHRGAVLRDVIDAADARQDGALPMEVAGVREAFGDELTLLGALQLRWHTRLSGRIDRELMSQPMDLEGVVVRAWRDVAIEMAGIRAVLDRHREAPLDGAMADAMRIATTKEHLMLALMSGRASAEDDAAVRTGRAIEERARQSLAAVDLLPPRRSADTGSLLHRIRARMAAA